MRVPHAHIQYLYGYGLINFANLHNSGKNLLTVDRRVTLLVNSADLRVLVFRSAGGKRENVDHT